VVSLAGRCPGGRGRQELNKLEGLTEALLISCSKSASRVPYRPKKNRLENVACCAPCGQASFTSPTRRSDAGPIRHAAL
jgi:hypothetical protein